MAERRAQRRLAAILVADMVGYSRLVELDEASTLARQKSLHEELLDPLLSAHGGRLVKTTGDGFLVEFSSVVDAVTFSVEFQNGVGVREAILPADRQFKYRLGVSVGDVVADGDDIQGDGVVLAARLEQIADPGGVFVSEDAYRQLTGKTGFTFTDLGARKLKNIGRPVHVFRLETDKHAAAQTLAVAEQGSRTKYRIAGAVFALSIATVGSLLWWQPWVTNLDALRKEKLAYPLPKKPSIAVLPFTNLSGEKSQDHLAAGLSEDLITALSKVDELFVIARRSSFFYRGKVVEPRRVAEDLGVRYVIRGSVRRAGEKIRVNIQLVDALNGRHVWAERYDRTPDSIFAMQDEIILKVLVEVRVKLTEGERARFDRGTKSLNALLVGMRATAIGWGFSKESALRARSLFRKSLRADPNYARSWAGLAWTHWIDARYGFGQSRAESVNKGVKYAERAIKLNSRDPLGYMILGSLREIQRRHDEAIALREKAAELAPYDFNAIAGLACRLNFVEQQKRAISLIERARRLSPRYPWWADWCLGLSLHLDRQLKSSVAAFSRAIKFRPRFAPLRLHLAAVYVELGLASEARVEINKVLKQSPKLTATKVMQRFTFRTAQRTKWLHDLFVKAGLPE